MKIFIFSIGKIRSQCILQTFFEYVKRSNRFANVIYRNFENEKKFISFLKKEKSYSLFLFDEKGKSFSSKEFSHYLEKIRIEEKNLFFVVGPTDGFCEDFFAFKHEKISLSRLTFSHEIALLIAGESIYRSLSILSHHPYHRE